MSLIRQILIAALVFGLVAVVAGWGYYEGARFGGGWAGLAPIWPFVAGGLVVVALLAGGLMALAFFSARRGYDEPYDVDKPNGGRVSPPPAPVSPERRDRPRSQ
jgi:hypothetical protein